MKKLDELKISQTPWHEWHNRSGAVGVEDCNGGDIVQTDDVSSYDIAFANALIIAAAPKLYKGLYDAWHQTCMNPKIKCKDCAFNGLRCSEWRAALAEASGEGAGDGK